MKNNVLLNATELLKKYSSEQGVDSQVVYSEVSEFLRVYAGENSQFYKSVPKVQGVPQFMHLHARSCISNLKAFISYLEQGLVVGMSVERKAQIDVVSDFLSVAQDLLENKDVHPASSAMIVGACLEEFLRSWVEDERIKFAGKPTIDSYATALRVAEKIDKQDVKDIASWGGTRNDAAHGHWDKVSDRERINLMLQGVNLFLRKHSSGNRTVV